MGTAISAEPTEPTVDWNQREAQAYNELKSKGASEAKIQGAIGHALLASANEWERAAVRLKKAVELDPTEYLAWYDLGLIYMGSEEGDGYLKKSVEARPSFSPAWYWLGYSSCRAGRDKDAINYFQEYLKVAQGEEEEARIETAHKVLEELRSRKPGVEVGKIRMTEAGEA